MNRGAWWATVHEASRSQSDMTECTHTHFFFSFWKHCYSILTDPTGYCTEFVYSTTNTLLLLRGRQQLICIHLLILLLEPSTKLAHGRGSTDVYSFGQLIHFLSFHSITNLLCDVDHFSGQCLCFLHGKAKN